MAQDKFLYLRRQEHEGHKGFRPANFRFPQKHGEIFPEKGNAGADSADSSGKDGKGNSGASGVVQNAVRRENIGVLRGGVADKMDAC